MAFRRIITQKWNRLRNEHKRINSLELWLHNGNRLPRMNPCTEVMNSRANALPWVHLYYCITPESIDKVAFFFLKARMALNWIKVNVIILAEANSTADSGKGTLLNRVPELVYTFLHIIWLTDNWGLVPHLIRLRISIAVSETWRETSLPGNTTVEMCNFTSHLREDVSIWGSVCPFVSVNLFFLIQCVLMWLLCVWLLFSQQWI